MTANGYWVAFGSDEGILGLHSDDSWHYSVNTLICLL